MKKLFLLTLFGVLTLTAAAQMTHKPVFRPDWVFQAPRPSNATYLYVVEHGEGNTKREAINQAIGRVFQSTANRIGQAISTEEINKAVQAGTDYEVIARNMKVPINKVCEFPVQDTLTNSWTMYILCQVAKAGNIVPEFEATDECTKHTRFDNALKMWREQENNKVLAAKNAKRRVNARALTASAFIPGAGQIMKKQGGAGAAFLLSEMALFGGGTAFYFLRKDQAKKINSYGISYAEYKNAVDKKNMYNILMYTCFGAGVAVHVGNMIHAWYAKDKRKSAQLTFAPAIIPVNEYTNPSFAYGAGVQITF